MKSNTLFSLALTAGLACMALALHAQAPDENKKETKAPPHAGKPVPQAVHAQQTHTPVHTQFNKVNTTPKTQSNVTQSTKGTQFHKTNANQQAVTQNVQTGNTHGHNHTAGPQVQNQAQFTPPKGNRANHYGGQWIDASAHADWGNSGEHYWHHHHYRWYDGGWLIFDPVYAGGSIRSAVQQSLSQQGYYNGPVDGDIGPGTRSAIANYQGDHGLPPTGHIDDPLLQSLGLE